MTKTSGLPDLMAFILTRGHHSNNSSATQDVESDRIAWFTHRTKRGKNSNWAGTSSGAEGDTLDELLRKVKSQGYTVGQIVMNHDTSANAIVCTHFLTFILHTVITILQNYFIMN